MDNKEYLNEESYKKTKKKITTISLIIFIIGILLGGSLVATGLIKQNNINSIYSEENKSKISKQLENEKQNLENKRLELEEKNIEFDAFTEYIDGEAYDLKIITNVLNPSYDRCLFDEYKNNVLTSKYCSLKNELEEVSSEFNKSFDSHDSIPFYMFGAFVIIASSMIAGSVYMSSKGREIIAFTTQQTMPIAREGIEKMAPTVGSAVGTIGKELAKGIKEGLQEAERNKDNK